MDVIRGESGAVLRAIRAERNSIVLPRTLRGDVNHQSTEAQAGSHSRPVGFPPDRDPSGLGLDPLRNLRPLFLTASVMLVLALAGLLVWARWWA